MKCHKSITMSCLGMNPDIIVTVEIDSTYGLVLSLVKSYSTVISRYTQGKLSWKSLRIICVNRIKEAKGNFKMRSLALS